MKPSSPGSRPVLAIAGPTASGKSALALALAARLQRQTGRVLELISVDSAQVYRGMDVGTAKPSVAERAAVTHHLIDLREPEESYSAAAFCADAQAAMQQVEARGHVPLLVGGTMLYFKALRDGLSAMPAADAQVRAGIEARAAAEGWPALHAELARVDPATAARLARNDAQRVGRALEVWQISGRPMSSLHAAGAATQGRALALLSLEPASRNWLHERIAQRFEAMLRAGLLQEVQRLRERPGLHAGLPSMRCVGYRQAWEALDAAQAGRAGALEGWRERGIAATRQLAKRQLTWLRGWPQAQVLAAENPHLQEAAWAWLKQASRPPGQA
jgi:tRNA dimethylallyltransferase